MRHRQAGPTKYIKTRHLTALEIPPVVRHGQSGLPKHADERHKEQPEAEGAPIDEAPRQPGKTHLEAELRPREM